MQAPRLAVRWSWALGLTLLPILCTLPARAERLHVVLAVDWSAPAIGEDMGLSRDDILAAVVVNTPAEQCVIWEVHPDRRKANQEIQSIQTTVRPTGTTLSRQAMLQAIDNLEIAQGDSVLFYYCGHGAYSPSYGTYTMASGDRWPTILYLSEIRDALQRKGPRFAAVILDCCNTLRAVPGEPRAFVPFAAHRPDFSPLFQRLFFGQEGMLTVTSSKGGEYSLIIPAVRFRNGEQHFGALFSGLFSKALISGTERPQSWENLLGSVQQKQDREFARICQRGAVPLANGQFYPQARQTIVLRW